MPGNHKEKKHTHGSSSQKKTTTSSSKHHSHRRHTGESANQQELNYSDTEVQVSQDSFTAFESGYERLRVFTEDFPRSVDRANRHRLAQACLGLWRNGDTVHGRCANGMNDQQLCVHFKDAVERLATTSSRSSLTTAAFEIYHDAELLLGHSLAVDLAPAPGRRSSLLNSTFDTPPVAYDRMEEEAATGSLSHHAGMSLLDEFNWDTALPEEQRNETPRLSSTYGNSYVHETPTQLSWEDVNSFLEK